MSCRIAVFPGDGVGPEVIKEGIKVIEKAAELNKSKIEFVKFPHNAEYYLEKKELLKEKNFKELESCKAVYLGTFGDPRVEKNVLEDGIANSIRVYFDQFINLRPVRLLYGIDSPLTGKSHNDIDITVIRETTEDFYIGAGDRVRNGKDTFKHNISNPLYKLRIDMGLNATKGNEVSYQIGILSKKASERAIKFAFDYAKSKGKKKVTGIHKPNQMEDYYSIWKDAFEEVSKSYEGIEKEFHSVNTAMMLMLSSPEKYSVIVAPNMFGEMITHIGAVIQGGFGMAASANINPNGISSFQPLHGSAPNFAGKNIVNPIATIWAGALMLDTIGEAKSSSLIMKAIEAVLKEGKCRTQDLGGLNSASEMGDAIVNKMIDLHE